MAEIYTGMTVFGLFDNNNGNALFGVPGAASPGSALQIAGSDGTHLRTILTDATGAVVITGSISATNPSVAPTGAAVPADATYIGANQAGNLVGLTLDGSGNLKVAQQGTVTVSGTVAVTQSTSPWVVRDAADGTPGSAVPGTAIQIAGSDSTNLRTIKVTTAGTQVVIPADQAEAGSLSYFSYDSGAAYTTVTSANTPLWSIRANSASVNFLLRELQWYTDGSATYFQLVKNASLTGSSFAATSPSTNVQVDTAAASFTGGTVVMSGYVGATPRSFDNLLTAMAAGTPGDTFTMAASTLGTQSRVAAQIRWSENSVTL